MTAPLHIAFVSMHTSPADLPGSGDAGGMNVVEYHQAFAAGRAGSPGRPDHPAQRQPSTWWSCRTPSGCCTCPAAPPSRWRRGNPIDAHIEEFSAGLAALGVRYDVLHSHHWMSGVAALPVARAWGVPHVQSFHSVAALPGSALSEGEPPESPARVPGERLVATESDAVIAISAAEARTVVERCGADPERVVIVPPGVDRGIFHGGDGPAPGTIGVVNPRGYLLYAARLQPLKGPDLARSARWPRCRPNCGPIC